VPQAARRAYEPKPALVRLCLNPFGGHGQGRSLLIASLPDHVTGALGWQRGLRLGLAVGTGRFYGWVRIGPDTSGRPLRPVGRYPGLIVSLLPPEAWQRLRAPSSAAEHRVQGQALLVEIPWDMDNIDVEPAAEAEEVA
jgi:hypothetical protein